MTDPVCSPIKLNVLQNQVYMNNFLETVNYVTTAFDMLQKNTNPSLSQVSQVNTFQGGCSIAIRGTFRWQGRGSYHGGYQGRGRDFFIVEVEVEDSHPPTQIKALPILIQIVQLQQKTIILILLPEDTHGMNGSISHLQNGNKYSKKEKNRIIL